LDGPVQPQDANAFRLTELTETKASQRSHLAPPRCALYDARCCAKINRDSHNSTHEAALRNGPAFYPPQARCKASSRRSETATLGRAQNLWVVWWVSPFRRHWMASSERTSGSLALAHKEWSSSGLAGLWRRNNGAIQTWLIKLGRSSFELRLGVYVWGCRFDSSMHAIEKQPRFYALITHFCLTMIVTIW